MVQTVTARHTKYTKAIISTLSNFGHAVNTELLEELRKSYPELSATTVHRTSARLAERGLISTAPPDAQGSMRYDTNLLPHDHFVCTLCGGIRDIQVAQEFIPAISSALGGCKITGRLLIYGNCEICVKKEEIK